VSAWAIAQDVLCFGSGLALLAHEVLVSTTERKTFIYLSVVLMGGQVFRRGIEALKLIKGVPGD
jgi:phage FluMu protein gp41